MATVKTVMGKKQIEAETSLLHVFGQGFTPAELAQAYKLEIELSQFNDPGEDYSKLSLKDSNDKVIASRLIPGY